MSTQRVPSQGTSASITNTSQLQRQNTSLIRNQISSQGSVQSRKQLEPIQDVSSTTKQTIPLPGNKALQHLEEMAKKKQKQKELEESQKKKQQEKISNARLEVSKRNQEHLKLKKEEEEEKKKVDEEKLGQSVDVKKQIQGPSEEFLARNEKLKQSNQPTITDVNVFRKKFKLAPEVKIFIVVGGYSTLRKALVERGWFENPDRNSPVFDLKFAIKQSDVCNSEIQDHQIVNHFLKNNLITTKVGLCQSLKNLVWWNEVDINSFFPKCFDLTDGEETEDFKNEYRFVKAESILKNYMAEGKVLRMERLQVAIHACEKRMKDVDDQLDDPKLELHVTDKEWELLQKEKISEEVLENARNQKWFKRLQARFETDLKKFLADPSSNQEQSSEETAESTSTQQESSFPEDEHQKKVDLFYKKICQGILSLFEEKFPEFRMNGTLNMWILKPGGKSRGRGIKVFRSYEKILQHIRQTKGRSFVVMKYIENPLLLVKKKFDVRQWVLVTDWNPLTVWIYRECYVRFSPIDYDITKLNAKYMHLTNNSIVSKCDEFFESEIEGNMWSCDEFSSHLMELYGGRDVFQEVIWPQFCKQVTCSLQSVQDMVDNRKNSFEFLGYDFMIDEDLKVWLIEINSSPSMDLSTHVTERLVKSALNDLPKVIIDYPKAKKKSKCDTGGFVLCHKDKMLVEKPQVGMANNIAIEGKKITK